MYVTGDTIIRFATVLGALGTLGALLYRSFRWMERSRRKSRTSKRSSALYATGFWQHWTGSSSLAQTAMSVMPIRDWKSI
jgi:hypothetical protein